MNTQERTVPYAVIILVAITIAIGAIVAAASLGALGASPRAAADGEPHFGCNGEEVDIGPSGDLITHDAGDKIVTAVCIKAGNDARHEPIIDADGVYFDGCYEVLGIGTSVVTVEVVSDCNALSHIDVIEGAPTPTPTPTPTPGTTPTPTPAAEASPTPTPTALAAVQEPEALPASGGTPADGSGLGILPLLLALSGLAFLGGAGTLVAAKVRRRR